MTPFSCEKPIVLPKDAFENALKNTVAVSSKIIKNLEGHYMSDEKLKILGNQFICLVNNNTITFISDKGGLYIVCDLGLNTNDSLIYLKGYYRDPLTSNKGFVQLILKDKKNTQSVFNNSIDSSLEFTMNFINADNPNIKTINLKYKRAFKTSSIKPNFNILAHRGGGRNSDDLPYSENSIEMIHHATDFGANGVEIDVKLTSDQVPVIYHDDDINIRLTLKSPIIGAVGKYKYKTLETYVRLVKGEKIPKLEDVLDHIVDSTSLNFVWLDIKDANDVFKNIIPIVNKTLEKAKKSNRNLSIYYGIPSDDVYNSFMEEKDYVSLPSLCELDIDKATKLSSIIWAPRWTLGLDKNSIQGAQTSNLKVVTWTLDNEELIKKYISTYNYDGILTNYPSIVAYHYYSTYW